MQSYNVSTSPVIASLLAQTKDANIIAPLIFHIKIFFNLQLQLIAEKLLIVHIKYNIEIIPT